MLNFFFLKITMKSRKNVQSVESSHDTCNSWERFTAVLSFSASELLEHDAAPSIKVILDAWRYVHDHFLTQIFTQRLQNWKHSNVFLRKRGKIHRSLMKHTFSKVCHVTKKMVANREREKNTFYSKKSMKRMSPC